MGPGWATGFGTEAPPESDGEGARNFPRRFLEVLGEEQRALLVKWEEMTVKRRVHDREATPWRLPFCASLLGVPLLVALLALVS